MRTILLTAVAMILSVAQASASITIATFGDPALGSSTPLFTTTGTTITGSWLGPDLTLELPVVGSSFTDVKMDMPTVSRSGQSLGAGFIKFWTVDANNPIFTINFSSGDYFAPFGFSAGFLPGHNVTFGGSALANVGPLEDRSFAFNFANPEIGANLDTYTASMTSSAVPEPATLIALAGGAALLARRRRNRA